MYPIKIDVLYWPGLQGDNPNRIELDDAGAMITRMTDMLRDPTVRGIQVTVEKERGQEFL